MGEINAYKILVVKSGLKRLLGRRRWEDNIKMDLMKTGCEGADGMICPRTGARYGTL
jgi:hypothetical protein